ncbi:hypothetical protein TRVL_05311 [Trypanosoma vivax]|nr:hypothetical protein TRVL_05311 [Trypanosoma vivax]
MVITVTLCKQSKDASSPPYTALSAVHRPVRCPAAGFTYFYPCYTHIYVCVSVCASALEGFCFVTKAGCMLTRSPPSHHCTVAIVMSAIVNPVLTCATCTPFYRGVPRRVCTKPCTFSLYLSSSVLVTTTPP